MALSIYADVHIPLPITAGLRRRGIDVLRAQDDGMGTAKDVDILDRALELGRIVYTNDTDFLIEATKRQKNNRPFTGIVYTHPLDVVVGSCIDDLELIARVFDFSDIANSIEYIPY